MLRMLEIFLLQSSIYICIKYLDITFLMLLRVKRNIQRSMFSLTSFVKRVRGREKEKMEKKCIMFYIKGNSFRQTLLNILMV